MKRCSAVLLLALSLASAMAQTVFDRTDTQKEIELGREVYDHLLRTDYMSRNEAYKSRVSRVLAKLVGSLDKKLYPFQAVVIASSEVNAWCAPGGYVCVYEGMVTLQKNDEGLAWAIAHEVGHGYLRHSMRNMRKTQSDVIVGVILAALSGEPNDYVYLQQLAHSRSSEREADSFATELYLKAGFDPKRVSEGVDLLYKLDTKRIPYYLRTHPPAKERQEIVAKRAAELAKAPIAGTGSGISPEVPERSLYGELPAVESKACPWFPLEAGRQWDYAVKGANGAGYSVTVVGVADARVGKVARMRIGLSTGVVEYQCLTTVNEVWRRNRPSEPTSAWTVESALPAVGAEPVTRGNWTWKALGTEDVEVPAGKFSGAVKIEAANGARTLHLWFVEGIGLVRRLSVASGTDEVLASYRKP